jgi:hypothetical protein
MHASRLPRFFLAGIAIALATSCQQVPQNAAPAPAPESALPSAAANAPGSAARQASAGRISIRQWPEIVIDSKPLRAAPGARILNSNNLMLTPNMIPEGARVQYELDGAGQVRLIRVLGPNASAPAPASAPPSR